MGYDTDTMTTATFISTCQKVSNKRAAITREKLQHAPRNPNRPTFTRAAAQAASATPTPTTATGTHPGPMDLSSNRRKLSPEDCAQRMAERRFLYCGGANHMARNSPVARRPLRTAETRITEVTEDVRISEN